MKNLTLLISSIIALSSINTDAQNKLKRYDIKSGIVEYTSTISGKMMGSTINGIEPNYHHENFWKGKNGNRKYAYPQ
jgi:hypothetical protein